MIKTGFTRKKVSTLTLGERLRELRSSFRISLAEVSKATRIQVKYLEYLENGEYAKLPADVYVRGFVRSYARYLNLDEQTFLKLYDRERHIQTNLKPEERAKKESGALSRFSLVVTPRSLVLVSIALVLFGAFFYLYREFRSFAAAPRLVIFEPAPNALIEASEVVIRGQTERGARIAINNQPAFVGNDGEFSESVLLQEGINTVTVSATSRLEKVKTETLTLEARYTPAPADTTVEKFSLRVEAGRSGINIIIESDGASVFTGLMRSGETKTVEAADRIRLVSNNPAETLVRLNRGEVLQLGAPGEGLKEAFFTREGKVEETAPEGPPGNPGEEEL